MHHKLHWDYCGKLYLIQKVVTWLFYYDAPEHRLPRLHDNSSADTPRLHEHDHLKAEPVATVPGKFSFMKMLGLRPCVIKEMVGKCQSVSQSSFIATLKCTGWCYFCGERFHYECWNRSWSSLLLMQIPSFCLRQGTCWCNKFHGLACYCCVNARRIPWSGTLPFFSLILTISLYKHILAYLFINDL